MDATFPLRGTSSGRERKPSNGRLRTAGIVASSFPSSPGSCLHTRYRSRTSKADRPGPPRPCTSPSCRAGNSSDPSKVRSQLVEVASSGGETAFGARYAQECSSIPVQSFAQLWGRLLVAQPSAFESFSDSGGSLRIRCRACGHGTTVW